MVNACLTPYDFTEPVSANCTVYAAWGCNYSLTAHFLMEGAEFSNISYTIPYGVAPQDDPWFGYRVKSPSSHEGYDFLGWFADKNCTSPFALDEPLTATSHVYAAYVLADYPVTFHKNDGTDEIVDTLYLHKGDTVTPTTVTPVREDYTFMGYGNEKLLQLHLQNTSVTSLDLSGCVPMAQAVQTGEFTDAADYDQYFVDYNGDRSLIVPKGTTFVIGGIPIDEAHFPDAGLRQYLSNKLRDKNGNGALSDDEIKSITSIWADSSIRSLEGWDYLPYVTYVVSYHDLESIDLSGHPNVDTLVLKNSRLTRIDVSGLTRLTHLDVSGSTGLETMILGEAPLETLNCYGCPLLRTLDLSCQPQLLKAYLDGWGEMDEDGDAPYMYYTWQNEEETLLGFLRVDPEVRFSQPHWSWTGKESASFILPNGTACPAEVNREVNEDSTLVTYTARALLGEVPFEDSKTYGLITYFGTDTEVPPEQEFEIGSIPEVPQDPFLGGSLFDGWYLDPERTVPCDFSEARAEGLMVYAKWITPDPEGMVWLPDGLREIESEAFSGIRAQAILAPRSFTSMAPDALLGSAIQYIYGYPESRAEEFAAACGCVFVPVDDAWIESHR